MYRLKPIANYFSTPSWLMAWAALSLLMVLLPPALGNLMILAAGSGESRSVRYTGAVTCTDILRWSDWHNGAGSLCKSELYEQLDKDAQIVQYRVGTSRKYFALLTFYQARYRLPNGSIIAAHASGPLPLIGVDSWVAFPCSAFFGMIAVACFIAVGRCPSPSPIVRITDSSNIPA